MLPWSQNFNAPPVTPLFLSFVVTTK